MNRADRNRTESQAIRTLEGDNMTILIVAVIILSFLIPLTAMYCFKKGFNYGLKVTAQEEIKEKAVKLPAMFQKKAVPDKWSILAANIDNYNGTSEGQVKI